MAPEAAAPTSIHAGPTDGWHGQVSSADSALFPPEKGRYHLYIGLFCPFAHRVNLVRHLKGLTDDILPVSVVRPYPKGPGGWQFDVDEGDYAGATPDRLFGSEHMRDVYLRAEPAYAGKYSVPLLWDTQTGSVVSNESLEMMRWLQTGFDAVLPPARRAVTLYPPHLRAHIDEAAAWVARDLNSGVYKAGGAASQAAYDAAVVPVFAALNRLEAMLHARGGPFLLGADMTELDVLAYASVARFDVAYVHHFRCNLGTVRHDYPHLHEWYKNLYWNVEGFRETTDFGHIKDMYAKSNPDWNPPLITPMGPFPHIEEGVNLNFKDLRVGAVTAPEVLAYQAKLSPAL